MHADHATLKTAFIAGICRNMSHTNNLWASVWLYDKKRPPPPAVQSSPGSLHVSTRNLSLRVKQRKRYAVAATVFKLQLELQNTTIESVANRDPR